MKTKTLLIAAVMFIGLSAAAFAQATFSVGSIPVTAVVNTGQVELTGDITFSQVTNGNLTQLGTITVSYPVPITVGIAGLNADTSGVRIRNASGFTISTANPPSVTTELGILSVSSGATTGQGQIVIQIPALAGPTSSFTLTGVRVAVAGTTLTSLAANVSTTNNAITAGQTGVTVVNSIAPGIASIKTDPAGQINATTGAVVQNPSITVKEGFLNAWGDPLLSTNAGVRITFSSAPPTGVSFTLPNVVTSNGAGTPSWQAMDASGTVLATGWSFTSTSTSLVAYYKAVSATDPTKQETLTIPVTITTDTSKVPLSASTVTYVVSMAPIGTAFDADNKVLATPIPRYAALDVGPATLFGTLSNTTTLLVPFAQTVTAVNYNTGFAVANTTEDPGPPGITKNLSPIPQSGAITFWFFPQVSKAFANPANFSYTTTAGSPGTGIDAAGKVPSGSTYTVLLSELLAATGAPADFSGYVMIVCNFTNAHALFNISNYSGFSQGAIALVVLPDRSNPPEGLNN